MRNWYILVCLLTAVTAFSQVPQGINYQAIVRDGAGDPVTTGPIAVDVTITNGSGNFSETHNVTPNQFGLVNFVIGSINTAAFQAFDFMDAPLSISIDAGGNNLGVQNLQSVPFSLIAEDAMVADSVRGVDISGLGSPWVPDANGIEYYGNIALDTDPWANVSFFMKNDDQTALRIDNTGYAGGDGYGVYIENEDRNYFSGQLGVGVLIPDTDVDLHVANLARISGGYFGNVVSSIPAFGLMHASMTLDDPIMVALLQDKSGLTTINSHHGSQVPQLHLQTNGVDQAVITYNGTLGGVSNGVIRIKGVIENKFESAGAIEFEHTNAGTPYISSQIVGTVGNSQDMGELRFSVMNNGTMKESVYIDENTEVTIASLAGGGYVQADASGKLTTGSLPSESDPQVGTNTSNYVPRWNGASLSSGSIYDNNTRVGIGTNAPTVGTMLDVNGIMRIRGGAPGEGKVLTSDATGVASWQDLPKIGFHARRTNSQSVPSGSYTVLDYNALDFNDGSDFNLTTDRFTAPVDGVYSFQVGTYFPSSTGERAAMNITINGSTNVASAFTYPPGGQESLLMSITLDLTAGEYVQVRTYNNTGANQTLGNDVSNMWFSGFLVYTK